MIGTLKMNGAKRIGCRPVLKIFANILVFSICVWTDYSVLAESDSREIKKIAVMNFDNRGPGDEWQWLSKGLADMIITDLSASDRLLLVERERLNEITRELNLIRTGLVDSSTADQVGRVAKVDWVLFGSYLKEGDHLKIEAHILDLKSQELLRVEWVEGPAEGVMKLEKRLVQQLLERLDVPITQEERRSIMYVPTDSLTAFEHYSKSLDSFDSGRWFDAMLELRLSARQDPNFIKARGRIADLYYQLSKPEHAFVEYQALVRADRDNTFPEHIYYKMGRLLEEKKHNFGAAIILYRKILSRHPELKLVFSEQGNPLDNPPVIEIANANPRYSLGALERIAIRHERIGNKVEAAKIYWQIYTIMRKGGLRQGVLADLQERCRERFDSLFHRLIEENLNFVFAPSYPYFYNYNLVTVCPVPPEGGTFNEEMLAQYNTAGEYKMGVRFLAPKDKEIDEVAVTVDTDTAEPFRFDRLQIDCRPFYRKQGSYKHFKLQAGEKTAHFKLKPGNRTVRMFVNGKNTHLEIEIKLREWSGLEDISQDSAKGGTLILDYYPDTPAEIYIDGERGVPFKGMSPGKHVVNVSWKGGGWTSQEFNIAAGQTTKVYIYKGKTVLSRIKLADKGSHTHLMVDQKGKIWLLWDQAGLHSWPTYVPDEGSDLYYATSLDGNTWSQPRKLSISSSEMDMRPILQQDGRGVYWLVWCSNRDPDEPKWLWVSSSADGTKWAFPWKINLPKEMQMDPRFWRELGYSAHSFSIDMEGTFWLNWQTRLAKSDDTKNWMQTEVLANSFDTGKPFRTANFLYHDYGNRLLVLAISSRRTRRSAGSGRTRGYSTRTLWQRNEDGTWKSLGDIADYRVLDAFLTTSEGVYLTAYSANKGIFLRSFERGVGWCESIPIENHISRPGFPSVAALPDGRALVAYSCKDGVIAKLCNVPRMP